MVTFDSNKLLYVSVSNDVYYFYTSASDRDLSQNAINEKVFLSKGIQVTFDFNHDSHNGHRMVMTIAGTTHSQVNANYIPGLTDYSKILFDQGAFGRIPGLQPMWTVADTLTALEKSQGLHESPHANYLGNLRVFCAHAFNPNVRSSIDFEIVPKVMSINNGISKNAITGGTTKYVDTNGPNVITVKVENRGNDKKYVLYQGEEPKLNKIDGENGVKLAIQAGATITFILDSSVTDSPNHPIKLSNSSNWSDDGFANLAVNSSQHDVTFSSTPDDVYIHCTSHTDMGSLYTTGTASLISIVNSNPNVCFHESTLIDTEDGLKEIKDLKRGDNIVTLNGLKPLARLMKNEYIIFGQEFVRFPQGCLGPNLPTKDVLVTKPHPLMFDFKLVKAEEFVRKIPGVKIVKSLSDQYNLLFETQEYVTVEGLTFVSHHPNHNIKGLKQEEYFNILQYRPGHFKEHVHSFKEIAHCF